MLRPIPSLCKTTLYISLCGQHREYGRVKMFRVIFPFLALQNYEKSDKNAYLVAKLRFISFQSKQKRITARPLGRFLQERRLVKVEFS